jgi:toxin-antitoxin system PIN domain toxin
MSHLLDVNVLVALLTSTHIHHGQAQAWAAGKAVTICPVTELGFIRIATGPGKATMANARKVLADFIRQEKPSFIPADLSALDGQPAPSSTTTTDWYLANLAARHGLKLATFDKAITHPDADLIS